MTHTRSHSKPEAEPGLDSRSLAASLPNSLLSHLSIPPNKCFPILAPIRSYAGQWTGQDPVLKATQTHLVSLIKKPPGRENRSGVVGQEEGLTAKLYQETFWCDGAVGSLS